MVTPEDAQAALSRAISDIDLNKALKEVQNQPENLRYTAKDLLSLRPEKDNGERVEATEVGCPTPDGVMTPPFSSCPKPPPPTPATPINYTHINSSDEHAKEDKGCIPGTSLPSVIAGPEKKKKKKSSGKFRKPAPTGFEGM